MATEGQFPKAKGDILFDTEVNQFFRGTPLIYSDYQHFSGAADGEFGFLVNSTGGFNQDNMHIDCGGINFNDTFELIFNMTVPAISNNGSFFVSLQSGIGNPTGSVVGFSFISGTNVAVAGFTGSGGLNEVGLGSVTTNIFHRYRLLGDGTDIKYFVDGVLAGSSVDLPLGSFYNQNSSFGKFFVGVVAGSAGGQFSLKGWTLVNFEKFESY